MKAIKRLKEKGYTIAVDDYEKDYKFDEIIKAVSLVKVDFMANTREEIENIVVDLKNQGKQLLAEKVETKEEYEWAKSLGFDLFQGYYFAKPTLETKKSMDSNGLQYVRLMSELNNKEPDYKKLSDIILVDVSLTYKLLKLVNSWAKPVHEITSIRQAISTLGMKSFQRWISLAMVGNMATKETSELVKIAMIRSSLLNRIGEYSNLKKFKDELSLLGTLSILDVMLEMDMKDALETLPIGEEMKSTLLGEKTKYYDAMHLCLAYEKGVFDDAEEAANNINYDLMKLPEHYVEAISWSDKMFRELRDEKRV
jgi:EAL and modified HD-GYP domain-containing signal transduction protein